MKVLFFYQYFGTPAGSWSTRVYELTRRWVRMGYEVTVVTAPYEKSDITGEGFICKKSISGINLIIINSGDSNRLSTIVRALRALVFAFTSIYYSLNLKYDIIIASSGPITIGLPLIAARKLRRKKTIFEVRDLWPAGGIEMGLITKNWQKKGSLWFEKLCYFNSDFVITSSIGQEKNIKERFPSLKTSVIPNASDLDLFGVQSKESLPDWTYGKKMFTHIGSIGLIHNINYWVLVAEEMRNIEGAEDIIFVFIGDGIDRKYFEEKVKEKGLDNVIFLGLKPKKDLPKWVQNSVATLFATLDNPVQNTCSPNKIFDSFASGVPIIQTSTGWIGELVLQSNCGINVNLDDPYLAATEMMQLSKDEVKRNQMSKNAKKLAENEFNRDFLADKYLQIIKAVVEN